MTGCFALAGTVALLTFPLARAAVPQVKVLIGKSLKDVFIHGTDLRQQLPAQKVERTFAGQQTVNFNCRVKAGLALPSRSILVASVSSPTGLVGWESRRYRGELHLIAGAHAAERGCDLVNLVPMETYISSLLAKEMRADWPIEALKAQAVAARSYALAKMGTGIPRADQALPWHLESSEKNQVSGSFFDTTSQTDTAALSTAGEILFDQAGRPVEGFFHSKCGGRTLRPDQVWSGHVEGYRGVDCPFCHKHGRRDWTQTMDKHRFTALLGRVLPNPGRLRADAVTLVPDRRGQAELRVYDGNQAHVVRKAGLRGLLGREEIPSNHYRVVDLGARVRIEGAGYGHGVGMCQMGALELARRGYGYREILQHYFPELQVRRAW
jgi:stage II sporulation protein D